MSLAFALLSIFAIAGLCWLLNKMLFPRLRSVQAFRICPVCAGVAGTWLWMLLAKFLGWQVDMTILALLMGGSVVGIAYQLEKRPAFAGASAGKLMLWKLLFIPAGFAAAYSLISFWRTGFLVATLALLVILFEFLKHGGSHVSSEKIEELKKKMQNCC
ncbi:MAG: hypothetical protein WAP51_04165 [Candidatus Sungiibacteriota bacterium]